LTTKGLAKGLKRGFKGLFLVNPMHPMPKGLQGLKTGKKKPALGGSKLVVADLIPVQCQFMHIVGRHCLGFSHGSQFFSGGYTNTIS
jgi:hypothetical protein